MFGQAKLIGGAVVIIAVTLFIYAHYRSDQNLQTKVETLTSANASLTASNTSLTSTLKTIKEDLAKTEEARDELHADLRKTREKAKVLSKLYADHDFTNLVNKKPGLIQNRINKATKKLFKEIEEDSK